VLPVGVVDEVVVVAAEEAAVGDTGGAALGPGGEVVALGPGRGSVAALGDAAAVAQAHRDALVAGVEAAFPADVEGLGVAAEDDRDDPGLAGEPAGLGGGDGGAGIQGRDAEAADELVVADGDHDRRGGPPGLQ
jgi:hypothetical protein